VLIDREVVFGPREAGLAKRLTFWVEASAALWRMVCLEQVGLAFPLYMHRKPVPEAFSGAVAAARM
jgi:hypothetical protein